jgi:hypothetical protein
MDTNYTYVTHVTIIKRTSWTELVAVAVLALAVGFLVGRLSKRKPVGTLPPVE